MKTYALSSVEYQGKKYDKCNLVINEETYQAEVQRTEGLRKKQSTVATFRYGTETKVIVSDKTVQTQGLTMEAADPLSAVEIARILSMAALVAIRSEVTNKLQESMMNLLNLRASVVDFLNGYKSNPRSSLFSLEGTYSGGDKGPFEEYLENSKNSLSKALDGIRPALVDYEKTFGGAAADRVFAFVYASAKLQDATLLSGGNAAAVGLLKELGMETPSETNPSVAKTTEGLLRKARTLLLAT